MERPAALRIFIHATYCMKEQSYMKLHSFFESLRELRHFLLLFLYMPCQKSIARVQRFYRVADHLAAVIETLIYLCTRRI